MTLHTDKVDTLFSEWNKPDTPGCAIAILQNGNVLYSRGYGMADLEHAVPISTNSVFDIASLSKQFVAMSVTLLARQAKLSLDDEIQKYIPEIRHYSHPITVRHLIHHTSGIRDYITLMALIGMRFENDYPEEEIISLIARQKGLNFQPGEEHLYSNTGYFLLGEIVKRVSGMSLRVFTEQNIFQPLGMNNTHFHDDFSEIIKNRAIGYSPKESGGYRTDITLFDVVGDGGVYTTVEDLSRWDENFYHNIIGGYGQDLIEEITTPGKLNNGEALDYAFGLSVDTYRGLRTISHSGAWMGYQAEMIRFPGQHFSVICLSNLNTTNPSGLTRQVADIYLTDAFTEPEEKTVHSEEQFIDLPSFTMEGKIGFYCDATNGIIWELTLQEGKLMAEVEGMSFQIASTNLGRYKSVGIPFEIIIEFEQLDPQCPVKMRVQIEGDKPDVLERINRVSTSDEQLVEYSGNYYSEELDVHYDLLFENGEITLCRRYLPREHLKLVSRDWLKGTHTSFEFVHNEQNRVIGFNLSAGRVKNLYFVKQ